eukprot:2142784-Rhodomonas_salina.1
MTLLKLSRGTARSAVPVVTLYRVVPYQADGPLGARVSTVVSARKLQGPFAADLCPTRFPANSAFVLRQAADLDSDVRHAL